MKRIILAVAAMLLCLTVMAQEQASRTMRVFYGGQVVYMRDVAQMDSINFLLNVGGGTNPGNPDNPGQSGDSSSVYTENLDGGVSLKMKSVKGGVFSMGATSERGPEYDDEKPVHSVTLSDFYIGQYEVTQAQWKAVMGTNPCSSSYGWGDDYPVYNVSWTEAVEFCNKLSQKTGKKYRLPTEAEWEYAARGGQHQDGTKYAGSNTIGDVAWNRDNSGYKTHPVGQKKPNGLGLYDMSGNVYEWCSDWYGSYGSSSVTNPQGPSSGSRRVYRGGSWDDSAQYCRVSFRLYGTPGYRSSILGIRVVCEP